MTQFNSRSQFEQKYNKQTSPNKGLFADNSTGDISAADARQLVTDISDTFGLVSGELQSASLSLDGNTLVLTTQSTSNTGNPELTTIRLSLIHI